MIGGKEIQNIAQEYRTPSYVFDTDELTDRLHKVQSVLGDNIEILYAMKANPFLVSAMKDSGVRFEVCSPGEFAICEKERVPMERIVLSGVNKEPKDIRYVMRECGGAGTYTIESVRQFRMIAALAKEYGQSVSVLVRVTSGNQFGLDEAETEKLIAAREEFPEVHIAGIQCYTGTQKKKTENIMKEIDRLDTFCDRLFTRYGFQTERLEYGPGLFVSYFEPDVQHEDFTVLEELSVKLQTISGKYHISLEMGRYLAASCGLYLSRVEDFKISKNQRYCIIDGGINHINYYGQTMAMKIPKIDVIPMEPDEERTFSMGENLQKLCFATDEAPKGTNHWNICGSLCTVGDVVVKNLPLTDVKIGDLLVFHNIGAYSVTEGIYLFLSRDLPNVLLYSAKSGVKLVRAKQPTYPLNMAAKFS